VALDVHAYRPRLEDRHLEGLVVSLGAAAQRGADPGDQLAREYGSQEPRDPLAGTSRREVIHRAAR